jgi:hypothetical protein
MEQTLETYKRPYNALYPVVCMDEQPKQLLKESRRSINMGPAQTKRVDYEYSREGTCDVWMFVEPLAGWRDVRVSSQRTAVDWARQIKSLVDDPRYRRAIRITLVCDNLNTHKLSSLYQAFPASEALRIARRLEIVHTPKHGSWLNIAECELSALTRQCLSRHLESQEKVAGEVKKWSADRNARKTYVKWHFTTENARIKLHQLYPQLLS